MAVSVKMTRRPQVVRRVQPAVIAEVKKAYIELAKKTNKKLIQEISDWEHQPTFRYRTELNKKKWTMTLFHNDDESGNIYDWVSRGTGERGDDPNATRYTITPKTADYLKFNLPMEIKTIGDGGKFAPSFYAPKMVVITQSVSAPGIFPRHLGKITYERLKSKKSGSFHNETEAAIKRAFRSMGIYVG